ncbi:HAMP domain-containing sensor histidine kinase [Halioxenophilus sp. WMMB6]|uniref:sensor histidine kinase n=1 Tax=Halioxenophilus sp. WMMB6 TaxID=3073815 RepID=UPI00295F0EAA|nr:HAMP domain-containing sensor histidine kinase [Halioxenophilus sp. WMMB6]
MPIYGKLSLLLVTFTLMVSAAIVSVSLWSTNQYHAEITQLLNKELASYIIKHQQPLFDDTGAVRDKVLKDTAMHTMMINPLVEVYLLDADGQILGHALNTDDVILTSVDLEPIKHALSGEAQGPIYGSDPRLPKERCIFSVAEISNNGVTEGYLYVVLSSQLFQTLAEQLSSSYVMRVTFAAIAALLLVLCLGLYLGFSRITKPLKHLTDQARSFFSEEQEALTTSKELPADELKALEASFSVMQERIKSQFREMQQSERLRRELISNISHDLRTPLANIQGYIETTLLKLGELDEEQQKNYLKIALKHSKRLGNLISALFELSKLESRSVSVDKSPFPLAELISDISQEFAIQAEQKRVKIKLQPGDNNYMVLGDLSLIERVFQNLIDNALRHTPEGGEICIKLSTDNHSVYVSLSDTGTGISQDEIPYIFDRYYRSANATPVTAQSGTGLGLAIVKRILELHNSRISVISKPNEGARFEFPLPLAQ